MAFQPFTLAAQSVRLSYVKRAIAFSLALVLIISSLWSNTMRTYTARDDIYKDLSRLCRMAGVIGPSGYAPVTAEELRIALERIDRSSLSPSLAAEYDRIERELAGRDPLFRSGAFGLDLTGGVNIQVNIADERDFDFANEFSDAPAKDRRNETLIPYRYQEPALYGQARVYFGDHVQLEGDIQFGNNQHHLYETSFGWLLTHHGGAWLFLNDAMETKTTSAPVQFPYRAGIAAGNDFFTFILGRFPHSMGNGVTGNLLVGDNFVYQEVASMSFASRYFTYRISATRFDMQFDGWDTEKGIESGHYDGNEGSFSRREFTGPQQMRIVHSFDIAVLDKLRIEVDFGTMLVTDSLFDLRFFSPFLILHDYYNYTNELSLEYFDEANNIMALSIEGALGGGFSAYASFVLDQFQIPGLEEATVPLSFGVLGNLKHTAMIGDGSLDSYIEVVYTNPYLYLNGKYRRGENGEKFYAHNLDFIVGYHMESIDDYAFSGYIYGPDAVVLSLGTMYTSSDSVWACGGSFTYRLQGDNVVKHKWLGADQTAIDEPFVGEDSGVNTETTPSGGMDRAEHMFSVSLYGYYSFFPGFRLYGGVQVNSYINYGNIPGNDGIVHPMATIGVSYRGPSR